MLSKFLFPKITAFRSTSNPVNSEFLNLFPQLDSNYQIGYILYNIVGLNWSIPVTSVEVKAIILVMESRRIRYAGNMALVGQMPSAYKGLKETTTEEPETEQ